MEYINNKDEMELIDPFIMNNEIVQYNQSNPFYIPMTGSQLKYTKNKFLAEYKHVYILCLKDDFEPTPQNKNKIKLFHNPDTEISELRGQSELVTLVKGSFAIINMNTVRTGLVVINKELLECFNHDFTELNDKELVHLMLETKESNIKSWLNLYKSNNNFDDFIKQKIFTSYYELNDTVIENNLIDIISKNGDFMYWQIERNCGMNINKAFMDRKFNMNLTMTTKWNIPSVEIDKELHKLLQNFKDTKDVAIDRSTTYPAQLTNPDVKTSNKMPKNTKKIMSKNIKKMPMTGSKKKIPSSATSKSKDNTTDSTTNSTTNSTVVSTVVSTVDSTTKNNSLIPSRFVDGSIANINFLYKVVKPEDLVIRRETIEELLIKCSLNEREKYFLICNLIASKKYCHYVLNNINVMKTNEKLIEKYKPIFKYLIGYAWISLYMEESIRKTRTKQSDRYIFDIDTASMLPVFPFCLEAPHLNPYFCQMISEQLLNVTQNIGGVKQACEYQNGIVGLDEFKQRLNLFISGSSGKNLFEGADWSNMVICGGAMAAIIPKFNPLMLLFKNIHDSKTPMTDAEMNRFFQEYYGNSDIDIACNHSNILDFIDHVKHIKSILHKNLGPNVKKTDIKITPIKSLAIYINAKMLKEKCEQGKIPFKFEYIIANKNKPSVKLYFHELYFEKKKKSNGKNRQILGDKINEEEYFEIIQYCESEKITLIINDLNIETDIKKYDSDSKNSVEMCYYEYDDNFVNENDGDNNGGDNDDGGDNNDSNDEFKFNDSDNTNNKSGKKESNASGIFIKFSEILKYKIISKYLNHSIEIFKIHEEEFFSCVSRFHLPCVRSYYNGMNCYMTPSAITAYHTLTNIDFKYFVGSHDPINIIDKYRKRGYGTILNKTEINQYLLYIMDFEKYKRAYGISNISMIKNAIGCMDITNDYFKPRKNIPDDFKFDSNIKLDYQNPKLNYIKSKADIINIYKKNYARYSSEFVEKQTINAIGQIEPLKSWMIDAAYDLLK